MFPILIGRRLRGSAAGGIVQSCKPLGMIMDGAENMLTFSGLARNIREIHSANEHRNHAKDEMLVELIGVIQLARDHG